MEQPADFDLQVRAQAIGDAVSPIAASPHAPSISRLRRGASRSSGFNTPDRAAADVTAVLKWVAAQNPKLEPPALLGWSNGAVIALQVAQTQSALVSHVILFGFTPAPDYKLIGVDPPKVAPKEKNTAEAARSDFITPQVTPPQVIRAFVTPALAADPIFAEWKNEEQWNVLRADKLEVPSDLHGQLDPGADLIAAGAFMAAAAAPMRSYVVLPGVVTARSRRHTRDVRGVVTEFITRPKIK